MEDDTQVNEGQDLRPVQLTNDLVRHNLVLCSLRQSTT